MKKTWSFLTVLLLAAGVALAAWPTGSIDTQYLDQDTDSPLQARPAIRMMADQVNAIRDNGEPVKKTGDAMTGPLTINGNTAWHAGNDGSTSGLDADLWKGKTYLDGSFAIDFPSVGAAQTAIANSNTIAGVNVGDFCSVSTSQALNGAMILSCYTTTNNVVIQISNGNTYAVDPSPVTYYVRVMKK